MFNSGKRLSLCFGGDDRWTDIALPRREEERHRSPFYVDVAVGFVVLCLLRVPSCARSQLPLTSLLASPVDLALGGLCRGPPPLALGVLGGQAFLVLTAVVNFSLRSSQHELCTGWVRRETQDTTLPLEWEKVRDTTVHEDTSG